MKLEFTGKRCDVTPYTNNYQPITNVPVVNAVTVFTDESSGETAILHFNQVLWDGKRMKMSLINPNQLRHYGMTVSDDPTDSTQPFGISGDGIFVPFQMDGTTIYFEARVPISWELENCKSIEVTDSSTVWNPSNVTIASVTTSSDLPLLEVLTRITLASLHVVDKNIPDETHSDLTPYDDATLLKRMICNVNVATAFRFVCGE